MFVHLTQLSLGLSYTRFSMSGMASFGCTKSCFSVLCGLSTVLTWSPSKIWDSLDVYYGSKPLPLVSQRLWYVGDGGAHTLVDEPLGCPFFNRAFNPRPFSFSNKCSKCGQVLGRRINGCQPCVAVCGQPQLQTPTPA